MPPKRRKKSTRGSTGGDYRWALPGGDEVSALGVGFARMETARALRGARSTKMLANERLLMAQNQWYLGDRFGILIPTDEKTITTTYLDDLQAAQTRHQEGLETIADVLRDTRSKAPVLADGTTPGQLGRIYKHLGQRTSRATISPANWQDGAVTLRAGGPEPLLLLHKAVPGGTFFSSAPKRIPSPMKKLRL
jgi:hypothetical protein